MFNRTASIAACVSALFVLALGAAGAASARHEPEAESSRTESVAVVDDRGTDSGKLDDEGRASEVGDDNGNDGTEAGDDNGNDGTEAGDDNGNDGTEAGDDNGNDGDEAGDDNGGGGGELEPGDDKGTQ
jgi:hypothetical protein